MSDWEPRPDSPWSSERDRARRQRGEPPEASEATSPQPDDADSEAEPRFRIPTSRRSGRRGRGDAGATPESDVPTVPPTPPTTRRPIGSPQRPGTPADAGTATPGSLPDLPGQASSKRGRNTRVVVLGALLFVTMAALALVPRLLDDDDAGTPSPTPQLIQTPTPPPDNDEAAPAPEQPASDAEHTVCVDAGHGGWDTGFTREANDRAPAILEKEMNLAMAYMMKERLEEEGIGVVLTRPSGLAVNTFNEDVNGDGQTIQDSDQAGDRDELQARIDVCNEAEADLLISIHLNGFDNLAVRGYEVIYTPAPFRDFGDRNLDFATFIYREIGAAYESVGFETTPRGAFPDTDLDVEMHAFGSERHLIMTGPGVENADYTITPSDMPGAVVEPVFISNDDDAAFIADVDNQRLLVDAYVAAILTYFEQYPEAP